VISRLIKEGAPSHPGEDDGLEARAKYIEELRKIEQVPVDEGGAPVNLCAIPDIMEQADEFAWAGVGLGEAESWRIMCSLRRLSAAEADKGLTTLNFWGKILGSEADYYIAEAKKDGGEDAGEGDDEPAGQGVNTYSYYATTDLCGKWTLLPHLKVNEVVASTKIKKLFTGSLDAPVTTHPAFPGNESVLLRAQIARITADTMLAIKGYYVKEEDSPPSVNEEWVAPIAPELLQKESWTHRDPQILLNGRTTHPELPDPDPEDEPAMLQLKKMQAEQTADPMPDWLRNLNQDKLKWVIRMVGDLTVYKSPFPPEPDEPASKQRWSHAIVYVRSLTWPGAVAIARAGHFSNMYIGNGIKAGEPDFFPCAPPDIQDEPPDQEEDEEPQGEQEQENKEEDG